MNFKVYKSFMPIKISGNNWNDWNVWNDWNTGAAVVPPR